MCCADDLPFVLSFLGGDSDPHEILVYKNHNKNSYNIREKVTTIFSLLIPCYIKHYR